MQTLDNILLEAEEFFEKCNKEYPLALSTYDHISQTAEIALQQDDHTLLLSQLSQLETAEGYLSFQYISEARCLLRILNIINLEEKYETTCFAYQIKTKQELMEKYKLSLFALRRILFALSPESAAEAESFLSHNKLSPFAVYILLKEELIIANNLLFQKILKLYHSQWNDNEIQLFQQLISSFSEA